MHFWSSSSTRLRFTLLVVGVLVSGCSRDNSQREARLIAEIDSLRAFIQTTREQRDDVDQGALPVLISDHELTDLQRQGLSDPLVDIARDLRAHPELLPENPVPEWGGKFGFYDPEGIHLLTSKWVLAAFDDGHGGGHMLLEFVVGDSGKIVWKPIKWEIDD